MKSLSFLLSVLVGIAISPFQLRASHANGMQLTYQHLSGNLYRFHCEIFNSCQGVTPPATMSMIASSVTCGYTQYWTLVLDTNQTTQFIPVCIYDSSTCDGGNVTGFQNFVYESEITISDPCPDWVFDVSDCCRNLTITTLNGAAGLGIYVPARLNNATGDNSSPQFTSDPVIIVCKDQDFHYNLGMWDPDGDSITYELVPPKESANITIQYNPGYSVSNPLSSTPPVSFHYFTGDLFMHPTAYEVGVIAYQVMDWRNGTLMGTVLRDVIVFVQSCNSDIPTATGMNGTAQQFRYVFPADTVCFDVFSDDPDVGDTVTMTWNQTIPAATFVTNGTPHPTGTFCWTPTINDVRSQPYMFTVKVQDNTCPKNNVGIYSYFIYVTLDSTLVWAGVEDASNMFTVSPNPTTGPITIQISENIVHVKIFNDVGACIRSGRKEDADDISNVPPGIYFLEIISESGKRSVHKFIKE